MSIWWALVALAIFLIGVTKSGFGSGAGLMIVPMTAIALRHVPGYGAERALPLLLPLLLVGDVIAIWQYRRQFSLPIIALHLLPQRLERGVFVGTCALYFCLVNTAKLPGYYHSGLFAQLAPAFALRFVPLVLLGAVFGFWINRRIVDRLFTKWVYAITFALGWYILYRGCQSLMLS